MSTTPVDIERFRENPPAYLDTKALEIISVPANESGATTRKLHVRFQENEKDLSLVSYPIDVVKLSLRKTEKNLYMSVGVDGKIKMMKDPTHSTDAVLNAYYLPWGPSVAYAVRLDQHRKFFATAKVDGCCIIVHGDRCNPTVIHVNYAPDQARVVPETQQILDQRQMTFRYAELTKKKHNEYTRFYGNFAYELIEQGIIDGSKPVGVYDPQFYLSKGGFGTVFGVWTDKDGYVGWKFYYNIYNGTQWVTDELWPAIVGRMPTGSRS